MPIGHAGRWFAAAGLALGAGLCAPALRAQTPNFGGSIRGYQFARLESVPGLPRWDSEVWHLRLSGTPRIASRIRLEVQGLVSLLSPARFGVERLTTLTTNQYLPLQHYPADDSDVRLRMAFDRLNLQFDLHHIRITAGRQAVTWGVSYFWPALDLFAPFPPQNIDREYKPGVDAVRCTLALGPYSELDIIGASLGPAPAKDGAAGALARFHAGFVDFGFMGGRFHRDTVAGGFFTSNLRGTGVRGELSWTDSGDSQDAGLDRSRFWRGTIGVDRQLNPAVALTAEFSLNGYGAGQASDYLKYLESDRVRRGEINGLGRVYAGAALTWQIHPLWTLDNSLFVNLSDSSALWVPLLTWSTGSDSDVRLGAQVGLGRNPGPGGAPRSEYGSVPVSVFAGFAKHF